MRTNLSPQEVSVLEPDEQRIYTSMKRAKVLVDVNTHRLNAAGVILVSCGDDCHTPDIFTPIRDGTPMPAHRFALNGGALVLSPHPQLTQTRDDRTLLQQIEAARVMQGVHTIAIYAHRPCRTAEFTKIPFGEAIERLLSAKTRLKRDLTALPREVKVACFFSLLSPKRTVETHFLSRDAFEQWRNKRTLSPCSL